MLAQTVFGMPILDIFIRTLITIQNSDDILSIIIFKYGVTLLAIALFILFMIYVVRLFNVCVPTEIIPWCSAISKIVFLNIALKALVVGFVVIDSNGKYVIIEIILLFLL